MSQLQDPSSRVSIFLRTRGSETPCSLHILWKVSLLAFLTHDLKVHRLLLPAAVYRLPEADKLRSPGDIESIVTVHNAIKLDMIRKDNRSPDLTLSTSA